MLANLAYALQQVPLWAKQKFLKITSEITSADTLSGFSCGKKSFFILARTQMLQLTLPPCGYAGSFFTARSDGVLAAVDALDPRIAARPVWASVNLTQALLGGYLWQFYHKGKIDDIKLHKTRLRAAFLYLKTHLVSPCTSNFCSLLTKCSCSSGYSFWVAQQIISSSKQSSSAPKGCTNCWHSTVFVTRRSHRPGILMRPQQLPSSCVTFSPYNRH
jgi:hypothetical protein